MGIAALTKSAELLSPDLHIVTDEELQQLHHLLLNMMDDIAALCQEQDIPWTLTGGSALGAVRHGGFIPWDDDMDLSMFRADFERFKAVFPGRLSDRYELKLPGDPGYLYQFPKIYRKHTTAQNIQSAPDTQECVSIDIFIMENISNSRLFRTGHGLLCTLLLAITSVMRMDRCKENLLRYGSNSQKLCSAVKLRAIFAVLFRFFSLEKWLLITDRTFALCRDTSSREIGIPSGNNHFFGEVFLREKMCRGSIAPFSGHQYPLPEDPHYYLRIRYGADYMTPPTESDREKHAFLRFDLNT